MQQQSHLRIAVIGAQTQVDAKKQPFTAYRTVVNFHGQCYQRLLRYRDFARFNGKLRLRHAPTTPIVFPKKEWTRKISLQDDVVEARQVLLNEYINQVMKNELTPGCYDRLLRLLKVGDYDVESKGYAVPRKSPLEDVKGERPTVDVMRDMENEEADDRAQQFRQRQDEVAKSKRGESGVPTDRIGGVATIVNTSIVYQSATSSADTEFTEDERSMDERRAVEPQDDEEERSQVLASTSAPVQPRVKKVQFQSPEDDYIAASSSNNADLSPERKYAPKILKQLSSIEGMLESFGTVDGATIPMEFHSSTAILARNRAESV